MDSIVGYKSDDEADSDTEQKHRVNRSLASDFPAANDFLSDLTSVKMACNGGGRP